MRSRNWKWVPAIVALMVTAAAIPDMQAQCGLNLKNVKPAAWHPQLGSAHLMRTALFENEDEDGGPIVGMWHVTFTAHTVNGNPIPSNAYPMIDNALVVWHSDGTEIMNSARPPQDGDFCLGVWQKTGPRSYYLNHIPWLGNDTQNAPSGIGSPSGPIQITQWVVLGQDGKSYSGTFKLVAYNLDHTVAISFTGVIAGTRITTSTSATTLF